VQRYRGRISGPLLDRIDLHVEVARPGRLLQFDRGRPPESSATVRQRVVAARKIQLDRAGLPNAQLSGAGVRAHCCLDAGQQQLLEEAAQQAGLSPRACQRILKVARTVADLEETPNIESGHLAEAIAYRGFDGGKGQGEGRCQRP
jgi:magnesium chelatase family protein